MTDKKKDPSLGETIWGVVVLLIVAAVAINSCSDDEEEKPKVSLEECKKDLQCWADKYDLPAATKCKPFIERFAKYDFKWEDGILDPTFSHMRWINQEEGTVTFIGDKVQFQNGLGAWQTHHYECDFAPAAESVLDVRVQLGRYRG